MEGPSRTNPSTGWYFMHLSAMSWRTSQHWLPDQLCIIKMADFANSKLSWFKCKRIQTQTASFGLTRKQGFYLQMLTGHAQWLVMSWSPSSGMPMPTSFAVWKSGTCSSAMVLPSSPHLYTFSQKPSQKVECMAMQRCGAGLPLNGMDGVSTPSTPQSVGRKLPPKPQILTWSRDCDRCHAFDLCPHWQTNLPKEKRTSKLPHPRTQPHSHYARPLHLR